MSLQIERPKWWSDSFTVISKVHVSDAKYHEVNGHLEWHKHFAPIKKLLEGGVEVDVWRPDLKPDTWSASSENDNYDFYTHTGLLINISEIKKESAADVAQDFCDMVSCLGTTCGDKVFGFKKRFEKALEAK